MTELVPDPKEAQGRKRGRIPCEQAKRQANPLISGQFRKNRREKRNDSRRFHENSLPGRTGRIFSRTGMRRDIARLMRRLSDAFRAQARPAEKSGRNHGRETGAQAIVTTASDLPPGPRSRPSMTSAILSFTAGPSGSTKQQDMSRSSEAVKRAGAKRAGFAERMHNSSRLPSAR